MNNTTILTENSIGTQRAHRECQDLGPTDDQTARKESVHTVESRQSKAGVFCCLMTLGVGERGESSNGERKTQNKTNHKKNKTKMNTFFCFLAGP